MPPAQCTLLGGAGEIGDAVAAALTEVGTDVRVLPPEGIWDARGCDLVVACGPMQPLIPAISRLSRLNHIPPVAVWFTEQVPPPQHPSQVTYLAARLRYSVGTVPGRVLLGRAGRLRALGEMIALQRLGVLKSLCTFTETNTSFLRRFGLPAVCIPMGYHPLFGEQLGLARDIDVVFLGSTRDDRRRRLLSDLEGKLSAKRVTLVIRDGSESRPSIFGRERTLLLNRSKIMLNLMRQPWDDPVFRLLLAAPNGAMLLSEEVIHGSSGPFRPREHFAMARLEELPDAIEYYLNQEAERARIALSAYQFVTAELTMNRMAARLLQEVGLRGPCS